MNRRSFIGAAAASSVLGLSPSPAIASVAGSDRKFLVVFNYGGWDTTRVLSPMFDAPLVDTEGSAMPWSVGGFDLVDDPSRPSVRAFFERWSGHTALVHGMLVPSVAHEPCTGIALTGSLRGVADYATRMASADADRYVLPHLVMESPSFPADLGQSVARSGVNGQLDGVISGDVVRHSNAESLPSPAWQDLVDGFVEDGASARQGLARSTGEAHLLEAYDEALMRAHDLKAMQGLMQFAGDGSLGSRLTVAADALASGMSRVVSVGYPDLQQGWDTHSDNDIGQAVLWDSFFEALEMLMSRLSSQPGTDGRTQLEEVTVVVLSEMGRAPQLNAKAGKDHWPYTSAMLLGSGIRGGTVVGGYDQELRGLGLDPDFADAVEDGIVPSPAHLGATLLRLADVPPEPNDAAPIERLLG